MKDYSHCLNLNQQITRLLRRLLVVTSITAAFLVLGIDLVARAQRLPDLVPTAFSGPTTTGTEQVMELTWTVENRGTASAGTQCYDDLLLSGDGVFDSGDTRLRRLKRSRHIAPGEGYIVAASVQAPFAKGTQYLILQTNVQRLVREAEHTNKVIVFGPIAVGGREPGTGNASGWYDGVYFSTEDLLDDNDPCGGDFCGRGM